MSDPENLCGCTSPPGRMPDLEFQSEDVLAALQDTLLREHVRYAAEHSPFYRRLFASTGLRPDAIHSVNDLGALPFTTKSDLETNNPDFLCTDAGDIIDICLSSGTTGKPVALMQTRSDLDRLAVNEDVSFRTAGITARDRVLIATALDRCFMAGLAYFLGLTRIGATAIRVGSGSAFLLLEMLRQQQATAMVGVPTLMLAAAERLVKDGGDPASLGVRRLICIGEPIRNQDLSLSVLGERLRELWGAQVFGTYASTEMATAFCECEHGLGGHQHPDLIAVEIVDEQGRVLPPGEVGEVVATPLQVKGMPLLRFKTGDVAVLHTAPCPCGRRTPRLGPVLGRKAQMLKCRGTTVYPPAIAAVLHAIREVQGYYIEVHDEYDLSDRIRVVVGVEAPESVDGTAITDRLAASLRVRPDVVIAPIAAVQQKTVQSDKRKPVTFFDYRRR